MKHSQLLSILVLAALLLAALPADAGHPAAGPVYVQDLDPTAVWSSDEEELTYAVAWGDWDNDGDLDLATGSLGYLQVYENSGSWLETSAAWTSAEGDWTMAVAWGDWDNDGDLDLGAGNFNGPSRVYQNDGGSLTLAWSAPEWGSTSSLAWGDYDGDGDLDLAVGYFNAQSTLVYQNLGGDLTLALISDPGETRSVAWGDWDGDGDLDLALGNDNAPCQVYQNDGGIFTVAWTAVMSDYTRSVAWGDYDNDGDLDLAVGNYYSQPNRVYENDGGTLALAWSADDPDLTCSVAWGDWDSDGDLDLAVGNLSTSNQVYRNDGGTLALAWSSLEEDDSYSVAWGDWNADGDLDLAVGNDEANRVYENLAGPVGSTAAWSSTENDNTSCTAWADWDSDGDLDLAIGNDGEPTLVYEYDAGDLSETWASAETDFAQALAWGDWDGDSDMDLAVGNHDAPNRIYRNTGGNLVLAWSSSEVTETTSLAWGDWDGDGDLDLALGNQAGPSLVYENAPGTMTVVWSGPPSFRATSVAWGDYDGDGDLDLAMGTEMQPNHIFRNTGLGLVLAWSSAETEDTTSVAWGDYDGDGDLDLAVGNYDQPNRIYRNDGGSMVLAWTSTEEDYTHGVAWGDWDGDGDLDLACGNIGVNRVYDNLGAAGIEATAVWSSTEADYTFGLAWGDYDADGDLDMAAGNRYGYDRVYRNNRNTRGLLPNSAAHAAIYRPGVTDTAYFFSSAEVLTQAKIPIWYRLYDPESDPAARIAAYYSTDGGGEWHSATVTGTTTFVSSSPGGTLHHLTWNAEADDARSDNVVFRIASINDEPTHAGFPIQRPFVTGDSPPFRLRPAAVVLWPPQQIGVGPAGTVLTHTLTLVNRTGITATFGLAYNSMRGWPVDGPGVLGPLADLDSGSFIVSTTVPFPPPIGTLDVVTVTALALPNPTLFHSQALIYTFKGMPNVDLWVWKEGPANVAAGTVFTYTLVAHNYGPSAASGLVITETLPAEVEFAWAGQDGIYSPTLGAVLWPDHILFPNRSLTVTVAVTAGCVPSGTVILNADYAAACDQQPLPQTGPATTTTVRYDPPLAGFVFQPPEVNVGEPVAFTNTSQFATSFLWDFGDGVTSAAANPYHSYAAAGTYTVLLTAYSRCGFDQASAEVTATLFLQAGFESSAPICLGEEVVFTNTTVGVPPITYEWDFGDGTTANEPNPSHTYAAAGRYSVVLSATNPFGTDHAGDVVQVGEAPTAGFTYTAAGLTVTFVNTSNLASSYLWDFGDGYTSPQENPVHTYAAAGTYTVTLEASGPCGTNSTSAMVRVGAHTVYLPAVCRSYAGLYVKE